MFSFNVMNFKQKIHSNIVVSNIFIQSRHLVVLSLSLYRLCHIWHRTVKSTNVILTVFAIVLVLRATVRLWLDYDTKSNASNVIGRVEKSISFGLANFCTEVCQTGKPIASNSLILCVYSLHRELLGKTTFQISFFFQFDQLK